jgi:5-carboxymethyl-2-hydroxymuconate isomerase
MPHLIIEYSANLEADLDLPLLATTIHEAALATGVFPVTVILTTASSMSRRALALAARQRSGRRRLSLSSTD